MASLRPWGPAGPCPRELEEEEDHLDNGLKKPRWSRGTAGGVCGCVSIGRWGGAVVIKMG